MNNKVCTSSFFNLLLIFCLGLALAVMAPFDFDFNGFAPDGGGDVGGAFGHVQQILDGVKFTVRFTVITVNVQTL